MKSNLASKGIGSLNEKPLHAALKQWCARPDDRLEVTVDGFVIDILRDDCLLEIQTKSFASIKRKLIQLTATHKVRLAYPIAQEKWIVKMPVNGESAIRRKSPKRAGPEQIFEELVSFPKLLANPNFSLLVLLVQEEEVRRFDAKRNWRRKGWGTEERRLLHVVGQRLFETPEDIAALIPAELISPFTTTELAAALGKTRRFAQKMAYCLREMGLIKNIGARKRAILYERSAPAPPPQP